MNEIGCFGKVPAHGDFVWQTLPARFVTPWDNWLQSQLLALREQQPDEWLQTYLCGPIWRFMIQDEGLGSATWCGIVTPSVDIVGRYFPFTIATALPLYTSVVYAPALLSDWLHNAEEVALEALTSALPMEELMSRVREYPLPQIPERPPPEQLAGQSHWAGHAEGETAWSENLLDQIIYKSFEKPCHWSTIDIQTGTLRYVLTEGFTGFSELFAA